MAVLPAANAAAEPSLRVVATTSIIGDWVTNVAGNDVQLMILVGPNGDPHEYQPVPADSVALSRANLILENGLGLEHWLDKLCVSADSRARRVVLGSAIQPRTADDQLLADGSASKELDPHAWQDVHDAVAMVGAIEDALVAADPPHAAAYRQRGAGYQQKLRELDQWTLQQIHSIPPARRKLVTSHDAFGYFGKRYGLDISRSALESVTTEASDPSAMQIAQVVDQIKASGVGVIFVENIQNPRLMEQLAAEADVKVGPPLYSDALGPSGSAGDTYIKMIRYNVATLAGALRP